MFPDSSFSMLSSAGRSSSPLDARKSVYKYDEVDVVPKLIQSEEDLGLKGFIKQECHQHPLRPKEEPYCIYSHPTFSNDRGMIIFVRPSYLKTKLEDISILEEDGFTGVTDNDRAGFAYKLIDMPEKGGLGALATQRMQLGDLVITDHPLVFVLADWMLWETEAWKKMLKKMVDLLPIKGRQLFSTQHGIGDNEIDWITSVFNMNAFSASKDDQGHGGFAFVPEPAVSFVILH